MASADLPKPGPATSTVRTRLRPIEPRLQIALAMVLIAILGAITAYRGAAAEMENALLEQKLDQGRLLELYFRQDQTDGALLRETLSSRSFDYERLARTLMSGADAARSENQPERATALDLEAEQELAAGRAVRLVYWVLPAFERNSPIDQQLRKNAVQKLSALGFEFNMVRTARVDRGRSEQVLQHPTRSGPTWSSTLEPATPVYPALAFVVAGFVAALVLLTIADIAGVAASKRGLFYLGTTFSLLPVAFAVREDLEVGYWFAAAVIAFGTLTALGWWFGVLQGTKDDGHPFHPAELEPRTYTAGHLISHTVHDRFSQLAVLAIALSVLLSALVGAWFSIADTGARQAALDAVGFETDMLKRGSLFGLSRSLLLEEMAQTLEQRARLAVVATADRFDSEGRRSQRRGGHRCRAHALGYVYRAGTQPISPTTNSGFRPILISRDALSPGWRWPWIPLGRRTASTATPGRRSATGRRHGPRA